MARAPGAGRPAKPSALKVLHGDFEKDPQKRLTAEPKPKRGKPIRPKHITGIAKQAWDRICRLLDATGVLTVDCGPALEVYAIHYAGMREALDQINENGMVITREDIKGNEYLQRNPYSAEFQSHSAMCLKVLIEFGLTPSSRTRVQLQTQMDDKAELARKYLT